MGACSVCVLFSTPEIPDFISLKTFLLLLIAPQIHCAPSPLCSLVFSPSPFNSHPGAQELLLQLGRSLAGLFVGVDGEIFIQLRRREGFNGTGSDCWTWSTRRFPKTFIFPALGILTLVDFQHVFDLSQHPIQQPKRNLQSRFKQSSKHTWLYLGPGAHNVLHTLRNR